MEKMKVKIKDLQPNPFRDLENYPFNLDKIEQLKKSIKQTGFWDNVIARQVDGAIQIAYGHHRLRALQEVYDGEFEIEVPIKPLSDELMLKIMANENMEEWQSSVAVIDETVRAVMKFLLFSKKIRGDENRITIVKDFLGWPYQRVANSLSRVNAIDSGAVNKKIAESIPTQAAANAFASAVRDAELTVGEQKRAATQIIESGRHGAADVKKAVMNEISNPEKKKETSQQLRIVQFDKYLIDVARRASDMKDEMISLRTAKDAILDFRYDQFHSRIQLKLALEDLQLSINNTLKELNNE